ncbi:hypothetical protein N7463_005857 [Penicillium fimorum]|uniref:DUF6604 domain-containing protein n=1 Tax=Penicillium fimorum TaxID=1882269 RepID=A0A9X0C5I3_9EURO|nr:hypothetical protein N7463_005857 [Penicillium fimorum]
MPNDANASRDIIEHTWKGYNGVWDLVSASLTTNTAIDLLQRIEEEMKPTLDRFGGGVNSWRHPTLPGASSLDFQSVP